MASYTWFRRSAEGQTKRYKDQSENVSEEVQRQPHRPGGRCCRPFHLVEALPQRCTEVGGEEEHKQAAKGAQETFNHCSNVCGSLTGLNSRQRTINSEVEVIIRYHKQVSVCGRTVLCVCVCICLPLYIYVCLCV